MSVTSLNEEDYKNILKIYTKKDVEYISVNKLPAQCSGFMGAYFILEIKYVDENKTKIEKFFVKTIPGKSFHSQIAVNRNIYEKEKFFYNFLIQEYEKYGFDVSFAPKYYYCKGNFLVMEDLNEEEYKLTDLNDYNDFNQLKKVLKAVALFHSASIMYEEKMSEKLGYTFRLDEKYPKIFEENFFNIENELGFCKPAYVMTNKVLHFIIEHNIGRYKPEFKNYFNNEFLLAGLMNKTNFRKATGHGDLWYNNVFFQKQHNKEQELECKIIDYQVLRYSLPTYDVSLFAYLNCTKEFRLQNMKKILEYYYSTMTEILSQHGYNISVVFSPEEFKESLKFVQTTVLLQSLCVGTVINMPPDLVQQMVHIFNDYNWHDEFFEFVKSGYMSNEKYKKILLDIVDDLYDSIFDKKYVQYF